MEQPLTTVKIVSRRTRSGKTTRVMWVYDIHDRPVAKFTERQDRSGNGKGEWFVGAKDRAVGRGRNRFNFFGRPIHHAAVVASNRQLGRPVTNWRLP